MLFQPFRWSLYTYSFVTLLAGTVDVHHRLEVSGVSTMAEIRVENLQKRSAASMPCRSSFVVEDGEFLALLGPVRLRQDHHAAHDRRAGTADQRGRSCSTART
jgi:hypothetical protein